MIITKKMRISCKHLSLLVTCLILSTHGAAVESSTNLKLTDDNWAQILEGEWMIEFYAPWCPACRNLDPIWQDFSTWSKDLGISIGQIDITKSPGLSGRFMITALPTIYHVKNGEFRQYRNARTKDDFLAFVEEKKWTAVDPIPSWQSPASFQMSIISQFYRISMTLRNVMNTMTSEYGLPTWASYAIFGGLTISLGLILGLLLVCIIDFVYPPKKPLQKPPTTQEEQEELKDDVIEDDTEDSKEDDDENESVDESQDEKVEKLPPPSPSKVVRRRPKKID